MLPGRVTTSTATCAKCRACASLLVLLLSLPLLSFFSTFAHSGAPGGVGSTGPAFTSTISVDGLFCRFLLPTQPQRRFSLMEARALYIIESAHPHMTATSVLRDITHVSETTFMSHLFAFGCYLSSGETKATVKDRHRQTPSRASLPRISVRVWPCSLPEAKLALMQNKSRGLAAPRLMSSSWPKIHPKMSCSR